MKNATPSLPSLNEVRAAVNALQPYIIRTPLLRLDMPGGEQDIYLKLENLQPIGAYKVRSMGNILLTADADALRHGAYTASSGNAGLGLAWIAQKLGISARIYAPQGSPPAKLDAIRKFGGHIHLLSHDDWWRIIVNGGHASDPGLYADAVRSPAALAGNGTIGLEIMEQLPDVARIIVPFGGGGIVCGIAAAVRALQADTRIVIAESDAATPATAAFREGRPVPVVMKPSFISGAGAPRVLEEMWPLIQALVDETRVVPVSGVVAAIRLMCAHSHVVAEGAGAISVAAALAENSFAGKTVCVVSGGNIDLEVMAQILLQQL